VSVLGGLVEVSSRQRSSKQQAAAWGLALLGPVLLTVAGMPFRSSLGLAGFLICALLVVVLAAAIGGVPPACLAVVLAVLVGGFFFAPPYDSLDIYLRPSLVAVIAFVIVSGAVGLLVDQLARLAEQELALRRVATLVASGVPAQELFAAAAEQVGRLLSVDLASMGRYESDATMTVVAGWNGAGGPPPGLGEAFKLGGRNLSTFVAETRRPARIDRYEDASGGISDVLREAGMGSAVGAPIIVEGHLWGLMIASSKQQLPAHAEDRLASFTELLATAIANAESRAELVASRARIVTAADEGRRRIERDLHDGAQQRLVHAVIVLKLALRALADGEEDARGLVAEGLDHAEQANAELRELAHGLLPAVLTRGGLRAGVDALVSRVSLPVSVEMSVGRLPANIEATAYFLTSEALTNVIKHAGAERASVTALLNDGVLEVEIVDDGVGGARGDETSGLGGLHDRVSAMHGRLVIESPPGNGTRVYALLPIPDDAEPPGDARR
jgi:signal transduction histidine kinase